MDFSWERSGVRGKLRGLVLSRQVEVWMSTNIHLQCNPFLLNHVGTNHAARHNLQNIARDHETLNRTLKGLGAQVFLLLSTVAQKENTENKPLAAQVM